MAAPQKNTGFKPLDIVKAPLWIAGIAGSDKNFADNKILGSETLNRQGLHVGRVKLAANMAAMRRKSLAKQLDPADVAKFDRDGIFIMRNLLPDAEFQRLKDEIFGGRFDAQEQRQGQGQAVERRIPLGSSVLAMHPALAALVGNPTVLGAIRYAAARGGRPIFYIQTIMSDPVRAGADPQTAFHADTFHSTTKAWYFLHDVNEDEGPFMYVAGSHLPTPKRLEWEYEQSIGAAKSSNRHHAVGSFRITTDEIAALGFPPPMRVAVPANTLVVADTFGFHARAPSDKRTTRIGIHAYMRRNPFLPWNGLDYMNLPGIRGHELEIYQQAQTFMRKMTGKGPVWRPVGQQTVDAPANV
jgi:hypothetical protein